MKTLTLLAACAVALVTSLMPRAARADYFLGRCGGTKVKAITLNAACKKHPGKTVYKCRRKCVERKFLKCKRRAWKVVKTKTCAVHRDSKKNKLKTKRCNRSEANTVLAAYRRAKGMATRARSQVRAELRRRHSRSTRKKLERVEKWYGKILKKLDKRVTVTCKPRRFMCKKSNAHTVALLGWGMRVCPKFFQPKDCAGTQKAVWQASVIIHELAHKSGANDKYYNSHCSTDKTATPPASSKHNWSRVADNYEYWARFGFCIPGKCPR